MFLPVSTAVANLRSPSCQIGQFPEQMSEVASTVFFVLLESIVLHYLLCSVDARHRGEGDWKKKVIGSHHQFYGTAYFSERMSQVASTAASANDVRDLSCAEKNGGNPTRGDDFS